MVRTALATLIACATTALPLRAQSPQEMAPTARAYLDHVIELMETQSLHRDRLDWTELRAIAYEMVAGAQTTEDTYPAIIFLVGRLDDRHSRFIPTISYLARTANVPEDAFRAAMERPDPVPHAERMYPRIALVRVPAFSGADPDAFARRIDERMRDVYDDNVCGWIVDVRGNIGGNMWPMLQGLHSLLGEGVPGYFVYPDDRWSEWSVEPAHDPVVPPQAARAVAVLHDGETASSGEAVVVAFRGRPQSRTFGQPTAGLSTANRTIELSDGARLLLTVGVYVDRTRRQYGDVIAPDEELPPGLSNDEVMARVQAWLLGQNACMSK